MLKGYIKAPAVPRQRPAWLLAPLCVRLSKDSTLGLKVLCSELRAALGNSDLEAAAPNALPSCPQPLQPKRGSAGLPVHPAFTAWLRTHCCQSFFQQEPRQEKEKEA